jgi:hypothetical protein
VELGGNIFPFVEESLPDNKRIRTFPDTIWEEDLVWHRDANDRHIHILSGDGWQLQFDNELPFVLEQFCTYYIPRETFHRVIKGTGDLVIEIQE